MNSTQPFRFGVVEGFFGLPWSWQARRHYADFLFQQGFGSYLYAPKADSYLRKNWHQPFSSEHFDNLITLAGHYASTTLDFGIGLSPFELYRDFNSAQKVLLQNKLDQINKINPDTLCILFDDMPGEFPDLARQQIEIMNFVIEHSEARNFIMCPTYYSDDPLLEKHFGTKPEHYLEDLGQLLDPTIEIFWTGPEVVSEYLPAAHLKKVAQQLQRKPLIWDNYPVNDSQKLCDFLNIRPIQHRERTLKEFTSGYMANPMNQAYLSQLPLYCLGKLFLVGANSQTISFENACTALCPEDLASLLISDTEIFQEQGLKGINPEQKAKLERKYIPFKHNPLAREVLDWLDNKYAFDPACLT